MCVFICVCVCLWHYPDLPCCADHRACAVEISADWPDDFRFCARLTWTGIKSFGFAALADFPNIIGPRGSDWRWDRSYILRVTDVSLTMSAYAGSVLGPQCITGRCNYTVCQRISSVCSVKSRRWINIHCPAGSAHRPPPGGPMEKIKRDCGMSTEARVVTFELQGANSEETGNIVWTLQPCSIQEVRPGSTSPLVHPARFASPAASPQVKREF